MLDLVGSWLSNAKLRSQAQHDQYARLSARRCCRQCRLTRPLVAWGPEAVRAEAARAEALPQADPEVVLGKARQSDPAAQDRRQWARRARSVAAHRRPLGHRRGVLAV